MRKTLVNIKYKHFYVFIWKFSKDFRLENTVIFSIWTQGGAAG